MALDMKSHIYLVDGHALLHRAWHAIPPLTTKDGLVVHALYGFMMTMEKVRQEQPLTHLAVCWDMEGDTFRDELFSDYKATREKKEDELYAQIPLIQEVLDAYGIPSFSVKGFEADDVLGTLARLITEQDSDARVTILTGDMDTLQLVNERVEVLAFVKGVSQTKRYTVETVEEKWGVRADQVVDYKALRGDTSDNIPGVKGIGEKTATSLLQTYGTLEAVLKAAEQGDAGMPSTTAKKITAGIESARLSQTLARIRVDAPVHWDASKALVLIHTPDTVRELYARYEFRTLLAKTEMRGNIVSMPEPVQEAIQQGVGKRLIQLDNGGNLAESACLALASTKRVAIHAWTVEGTLETLFITNGKDAYAFPKPSDHVCEELLKALEEKEIIFYDKKATLHALATQISRIHSAIVRAEGMDISVAYYLLHPGSRGVNVGDVLAEILGTGLPSWPETCNTDDEREAIGLCVVTFLQMAEKMEEELKVLNMWQLYQTVEMPLIPVLFAMERTGIAVDKEVLAKQGNILRAKTTELEAEILKLAGQTFNLNSPSQLAHILFDVLALPTKGIKRTTTGYSTAASELEKLDGAHPIIALIGIYREYTKLLSTYIESLPDLVDVSGRIHTSFRQTIAATGRLSSSDPNLQNIPIRTPEGRLIREAFVAADGHVFIGADYSQIELRLAAAFSGDETMCRIFREGGDIHRATAAAVFGIPEEEITKDQRRAAKAVNFGIIYGIGPRALGRDIGVSTAEASAFIEKYFQAFPKVRAYLDELIVEAKRVGYAQTVFGRRRPLPDLQSGMPMLRSAAERMAMNMPLQGAAADLMKKAMIAFSEQIERRQWQEKVHMVLQVHDELVIEVVGGMEIEVGVALKQAMEQAVELAVPCTVEVSTGKNWGELK